MNQSTPHRRSTRYGRALSLMLLIAACQSRELGREGGGTPNGGGNASGGPPVESSARPSFDPVDPAAVVGHVRVRRPTRGISGLGGGSSSAGATGIGGDPWSTGGGSGEPTGGQATGAGASGGTSGIAGNAGAGGLVPVDTDLGPGPITRFAVIGDYGGATPAEREVARLVRSFDPEFIVTTGDNNYPSGSAETIDANIGQFYHSFIYPYRGKYGGGATENRFFPTLGNHDWYTPNAQPYLDYFTLPGNERYYDIVRGNVHYVAIDSDVNEPDGITSDSVQGRWCQATVSTSTAPFRVAAMHHPPYSSASHGSSTVMQWPYRQWGFDLVLAGHDHTYERLEVDGLTYVVNGLGGQHMYSFGTPLLGSVARSNEKQGALFIEASATKLVGRFVDIAGVERDVFAIERR
jgi:hypothetical protein